MAAVLSWHVQNLLRSDGQQRNYSKAKFPSNSNCGQKSLVKRAPVRVLEMCAKMADNRFAYKHCWLCPMHLSFSGYGFGKWKKYINQPNVTFIDRINAGLNYTAEDHITMTPKWVR